MNNPLHELDSIKASQNTKDKALKYALSHHQSYRKAFLIIPIMACILLFFTAYFMQQPSSVKPVAYVTLDINPSLELRLDHKDTVIETVAYNQDAQNILKDTNIQGLKLQDAIIHLLDNVQYDQYLKNGLLEISVFANNQTVSSEIEEKINSLLSKHLNTNQFHCSQIDQKTHHKASSHHMSGGKYRVIETIMEHTSQYTFDELNQYSIQELYRLLSSFDDETIPNECHPKHHRKH